MDTVLFPNRQGTPKPVLDAEIDLIRERIEPGLPVRRWPRPDWQWPATFWPAFEALRSMELTGLSYPEEYGGAGADLVTQAIVAEELARVDTSVSLMFLISKLAMLPVLNFGSDELKARYVPRIVSGESQGSYCLSEADAGSDVASMTA